MVRPAGLESATPGLGNRGPIQMSYGRSAGEQASDEETGTWGALSLTLGL